jgi:hypothetical protein
MKSLLMSAILFLSAFPAMAISDSNPNLRICHLLSSQYGAEVYILGLVSSETDSYDHASDFIPFCRFGSAIMGTPTLLRRGTVAYSAYKNSTGRSSCSDYSATDMNLISDSGDRYVACRFSDESWVELETLKKGPSSSANANLNRVLGL